MLTRAFALSIAVHLAILLGAEAIVVASSESSVAARAPLIASLGKPAAAISDATRQTRSSEVQHQPAVPPKRSHSVIRVPPVVPVSPGAASAAKLEPLAAAESDRNAAPVKETVALAPPPVEPADAVSVEGLQQYRLNLAREARRFRQYPAYARERGWEGEVVVVLNVLPGSAGPELSLGKGSGHESLDRQALEMMKNAASRATMPDALNGRRFRISVPVQFRLDD